MPLAVGSNATELALAELENSVWFPLMETPAVPADVRDAFTVIRAALLQHEERLRPALEEIARALLPMQAAMAEVTTQLAPYLREAARALEVAAPALIELVRAVEGAEARTANALRVLAQHGWYLDPDMVPSEAFARADEFATGRADAAHAWLRAKFDARLDDIEAMLCAKSPARAKFFRSALAAHRRGDYAASIPLLLAQADGLCWDVTKVQLYARREGRSRLESRLAFTEGTTLRATVLIALLEPAPISAPEKERTHLTDYLNRHVVLHGESLDYDTALNSARAISLVTFVAWALRESDVVVKPATP